MTQTQTTSKEAKKIKNGAAPAPAADPATVAPATATVAPAAEPTPEEKAKAEAEAKDKAFRRFVLGFSPDRLMAVCEADAGMRAYFEHLHGKAESVKADLASRLEQLRKEAATFGVDLPGFGGGSVKRKPSAVARPRKAPENAPPVDPAIVEKVMADLRANPNSVSRDILSRTGIDAATFQRVRDVQGDAIRKEGTRGPHVKYSAA